MNRRDFMRGAGMVAATTLIGPVAGARGLRRRVVHGEVVVPTADGWLALRPDVVVAHAVDGSVRWRRHGVGVPRDAAVWMDRVFVSDASGPVHVFGLDGQRLDPLGGFVQPWGLLARAEGLFVSDRYGHDVQLIDRAGRRKVFAAGLNGPAGLAEDGDRVWVADGGNERLVALDAGGRIEQIIRHEGLWRPRDVAISEGRIHAASAIPPEVLSFSRSGQLVSRWRPSQSPHSLSAANGLIVGVS